MTEHHKTGTAVRTTVWNQSPSQEPGDVVRARKSKQVPVPSPSMCIIIYIRVSLQQYTIPRNSSLAWTSQKASRLVGSGQYTLERQQTVTESQYASFNRSGRGIPLSG